MPRRQWDAATNAKIVTQGLQGKPVAALGNEYQISQALSYQGREQCLAHASRAVDVQHRHQKEARLVRENARRKTLLGELTLALKTSDEWPA
jgi:hypothetical protein